MFLGAVSFDVRVTDKNYCTRPSTLLMQNLNSLYFISNVKIAKKVFLNFFFHTKYVLRVCSKVVEQCIYVSIPNCYLSSVMAKKHRKNKTLEHWNILVLHFFLLVNKHSPVSPNVIDMGSVKRNANVYLE